MSSSVFCRRLPSQFDVSVSLVDLDDRRLTDQSRPANSKYPSTARGCACFLSSFYTIFTAASKHQLGRSSRD